jgi:hypothetical protein
VTGAVRGQALRALPKKFSDDWQSVIPAQAGIHPAKRKPKRMDSCLRGDDGKKSLRMDGHLRF